MIKEKRVVAIIPARSGSKGLPRKNIRMLHGRPLLGWPVWAAKNSRYVDKVIVSTDSEEFADIARTQGAEVPFLRPAELSGDTAKSIDVLLHALDFLRKGGEEFSYVVLLEPTSPMTEASDIDTALMRLEENNFGAVSIVGISKVEAMHPAFDVCLDEKGVIHPYQGELGQSIRRQDLEPLYYFEGSLYISDVMALYQKKTFYHEATLGYVTPRWKALEIDSLFDFVCAEAVMEKKALLKQEVASM